MASTEPSIAASDDNLGRRGHGNSEGDVSVSEATNDDNMTDNTDDTDEGEKMCLD